MSVPENRAVVGRADAINRRDSRENVHKRYLLHVAGHNLSLLMRQLIGAGTPREAVAGGYGGIFVLLTPTGAMLVALGVSQSGQTVFAAAFLIWE